MDHDPQTPPPPAAGRRSGVRNTWLLPGMLALASGLGMVLLARLVQVPGGGDAARSGQSGVPELTVTRLDRLPVGSEVRERLKLLDPARLFLPARVPADSAAVAEGIVDRPGGSVTEPFPAALVFRGLGPAKEILRPTPPNTPLSAMEAATARRWFEGMTRSESESREGGGPRPATIGTGRMDIYPDGGAKRLATVDLPRDTTLESAAWRPIELSVLVDAAGMVVAPMITFGSGLGDVDERVRSLVTRELLPRLRLRPGVYRLVVGP